MFTEVVPTNQIWFGALGLSVKYSHPAYDTLFVALAENRKTKLLTYDEKKLEKFPNHVFPIKDYLNI